MYQLVNQYDTLKQGAWVVTGLKKDGSEAMRRTLMLYQRERILCFSSRLQAFYCREVQKLGYG